MIDVRFHRGVELPKQALWLDPWDPRPMAFVSHAHSDHIERHAEIILSPGTSAFMRHRLPGQRVEHVLPFGVPTEVHGNRVTLLPAGHIFGSAQIFLEAEEGTLLYTGDFKLRHGLSAEPAEWCQAETLIMETTFGRPRYCLPPTAQVLAEMIAFCRETLEEGGVPVLLGYSLGKAQEILCALDQAGLTPMLHGAVWNMTRIYRKLRPEFPAEYLKYDPAATEGKVLICPPSANRSVMLRKIKNRRVAMLSGWAIDPGAIFRYQCDAAFPLSDHADYPDLLRYVELVQPKRVLTLHGFAAEFARDLRARGIEAWALGGENQLELPIVAGFAAETAPKAPAPAPGDAAPVEGFAAFAALGEQIAATSSRLKKVELLREYLRGRSAEDLPIAATYLTGKPFAQADSRVLQLGWAVIKRSVTAVSGLGEGRFREIANRHSDAGRTTLEALQGRPSIGPFTLADSHASFTSLQEARGPIAKTGLLTQTLAALSAQEAQYFVKILTGDLRLGLKEGLVEEGIASAFAVDLDEVKEAHMLLGDIGHTALLAREKQLDRATLNLFRPIKCMLASPEPSAEAVWARIGETAWVEDKYDGIRAQLHAGKGRVEIYSRDLRQITDQFTEVATGAAEMKDSVILDGEIIAFDPARKLTFFDLQRRLGRKSTGDFFLGGDIPILFVAFDLLWLNGEPLLREPLSDRRARLEGVALPTGLERIEVMRADSAEEIEAAFKRARGRRNEGLIIKDPRSLYSPGRRGLAWLKLKKELATLDVVVVGAETGHGKRAEVLSDYTFAVRDEQTGALLPIGKAYTGLTDLEIEELTEHFEAHTLVQKGRYREVVPDIVLEVAFDSVQPSKRHASGLALRFPRIKAIRRDKTPGGIDTLAYARTLCAEFSL